MPYKPTKMQLCQQERDELLGVVKLVAALKVPATIGQDVFLKAAILSARDALAKKGRGYKKGEHVSPVRLAEIRNWMAGESPGVRAIVAELTTEVELLIEEKQKILHGVLSYPEMYGEHTPVLLDACFYLTLELDVLRGDVMELTERLAERVGDGKRHHEGKVG